MLIIQAQMTAKPGRRDAAIAAFRAAMEGSQPEPGCVTYRYTVDLYNADLFHIVELWENEAALGAHIQGEPFKNFMAVMNDIVDPIGMSAYIGEMQPYQFPGA
jgi:quinol monooxygenase YgiN